jgi:anti-sigma-K factor RskA
MSDIAREQLLGLMLGALESDEQAEIEAQLGTDPQCRKELALLRRRLAPLAGLKQDFVPPPGLAERTCRFVAEHRAAPAPAKGRLRPEVAPPSWIGRMSRLDMVMAATVVVAACLMIFPAVQQSRFRAHLAACQDNLRELGGALNQYSQAHEGYFPSIPNQEKLAAAGIYAPVLAQNGLLTEVSRVI